MQSFHSTWINKSRDQPESGWGSGFENSEKPRVENSKNSGILGNGMRKPREYPERIPSEFSQKSQDPGDRNQDLKIPKNFYPGIGIVSLDGISRQKANSGEYHLL